MSVRSSTVERPPSPPAGGYGAGGGDGGGDGLVRVAVARHLSEAEFLQGLLAAEGIPSLLRRTAGFDVPDFLAAGPRDVLVNRRDEADARDILLQSGIEPATGLGAPVRPLRLLAILVVAAALVLLIVWIGLSR